VVGGVVICTFDFGKRVVPNVISPNVEAKCRCVCHNGNYSDEANAMERALYSEPIFVLTFAYTESERHFADCYTPPHDAETS
jgi:hypothetical protein